MTVNTNYRGAGIAVKVKERAFDFMKENNITVTTSLCTSLYSTRVCEKMGYKLVYELPFKDYIVNGKNPLLPADPHTAVRVLVKRI